MATLKLAVRYCFAARTLEKIRRFNMDALKLIAQDSLKAEKPSFSVGDTVKVDVKIREGERERIQVFEGTVIAINGSGVTETFTVRRVSYGVGVERVFPVRFAEQSFIIFVTELVRLLRLKKKLANAKQSVGQVKICPSLFNIYYNVYI